MEVSRRVARYLVRSMVDGRWLWYDDETGGWKASPEYIRPKLWSKADGIARRLCEIGTESEVYEIED